MFDLGLPSCGVVLAGSCALQITQAERPPGGRSSGCSRVGLRPGDALAGALGFGCSNVSPLQIVLVPPNISLSREPGPQYDKWASRAHSLQ